MKLCYAGRQLFNPGTLTKDELKKEDKHLRTSCHGYYTYVFAGRVERLRFWRPTTVAVVDVTANLWFCGPARSARSCCTSDHRFLCRHLWPLF